MFETFLFAFLCSLGFGVILNIPRRYCIHTGFIGALGWLTYLYVLQDFDSVIAASFFGALAVGILGEITGRVNKKPATIFVIPGIIPLVPGYGIYYSILNIINTNYSKAVETGFEALLIAVAIACSITISTTISHAMMIKNKSV